MINRLNRFRELLVASNIEAALLVNPINISYFTGFTGEDSYLLVTTTDSFFITDSRYTTQASEEVKDCKIVEVKNGLSDIITNFKLTDIPHLGLELDYLVADQYLFIKLFNFNLVDISGIIDRLRQVKDSNEISKIKEACSIVDRTFSLILQEIKIGMTELEVAARLESHFKELGSTGPSFQTIVASGTRSALPHGAATRKKIEKGDFVTLDFGCYFDQYTSDITRTISIGEQRINKKIFMI